MKRFGMAIKLKPGSEAAYRQYHAAVWPEVLKKITNATSRTIRSFSRTTCYSATSSTTEAKWKKTGPKWRPTPKTQEWWAVMMPMQEPLPSRGEGEW